MHIKNAITVALQVLPSFPAMIHHGRAVEEAVEAIVPKGKDGSVPEDVVFQCQA